MFSVTGTNAHLIVVDKVQCVGIHYTACGCQVSVHYNLQIYMYIVLIAICRVLMMAHGSVLLMSVHVHAVNYLTTTSVMGSILWKTSEFSAFDGLFNLGMSIM